MQHRVRVTLLALALVPSAVTAQSAPALLPVGEQIRVLAPTLARDPLRGRYLGVENGALVLETSAGPSRIPVADVRELRKITGIRRRTFLGGTLGYLAGGLVAQAVVATEGPEQNRAIVIGGLAGATVGSLVGSRFREQRWGMISLGSIRADLHPGILVRVTMQDGRRVEGILESAGDELVIRPASGPAIAIARAAASIIESPMGEKRATGRGFGLGFAAGAVSGLVIGMAASSDCTGQWVCFSREETAAALAILLGAAGGTIGAIVGHGSRITVWERLDAGPGPRRGTLAPTIGGGRIGLAGRIGF